MGRVKHISEADVINLGSTYAYHDFSYSGLQIKGVNLANCPQYLDLKFIKKYKKYFKNGIKIIIVLPDFVFAANAYEMSRNNDIYYFQFFPWELEWFSMRGFFSAIMHMSRRVIKHIIKAALAKLPGKMRKQPYVDKEAAAMSRIDVWKNTLGIPSMQNKCIPDVIRKNIDDNILLLNEIIREIKSAGGIPYIVVPPVSEIMNRKVSRECMQAYLFAPISMREDKTVSIFNYLYDDSYQSAELYRDADCLNHAGALKFTKEVCKRLDLFPME